MQSITQDSITVRICGEIDLATGPELDATLRRAESQRPARLELDLTELEFLDLAGLRVIVRAQQRAAENGRRLVLTRVPKTAQRLLALTGVGETLEIQ